MEAPEPYSKLDRSPEEARSLAEGAAALWAEFLKVLPDLPVDRGQSAEEVRALVVRDVPEEGLDDEELLAYARTVLLEASMYPGHPAFLSYVSGAGTIPGAVAALLAAAVNQNVGGWRLAPAATEIEVAVTRWFADRFGLPETGGGVMTAGGAQANLIGLTAARDARAGWDVRTKGIAAGPPLALYGAEEVHVVSDRAIDMLGIGTEFFRKIPTDDVYRMRVDALVEAIEADLAAGLRPICVVASAGTVATGAIDPLEEIAGVCERYGLWFHVDGAYGGPAVLADDLRPLLKGIERADSIAFDPHKWLYVPLPAGCLLIRDMQELADAFAVHATYVHQDLERTARGIDLAQLGPWFSRGFSAFKVWLSLLSHGRKAYAERISHDAALARYLGARVEERDDFELMAPVGLSICCFRYVPEGVTDDAYLDALNERIMTEVQLDGRVHYSNAVLRDRFVLRCCIVNFRTEAEHLELVLDVTAEIGARLHAELSRERS